MSPSELEALVKKHVRVAGPDNGLTFDEFRERLGLSHYAARRMIRVMVQSGSLRAVRRPRLSITGVLQPVPVYVIAKGAEPCETSNPSPKHRTPTPSRAKPSPKRGG